MWRYIKGVEPPQKRSLKMPEEKADYNRHYDKTKRVRSYHSECEKDRPWLSNSTEKGMVCSVCQTYGVCTNQVFLACSRCSVPNKVASNSGQVPDRKWKVLFGTNNRVVLDRKCFNKMVDNRKKKVVAFAILDDILQEDRTDDEGETEMSFIAICAALALPSPRANVFGYVETVVPNYLDSVFKRLFRMSRPVFQQLVDYLKDVPELNTKGPGGIEAIPADKKIMITLWYLGSLETINKIADIFGIGEASVIDCRNSVILSILKYLKHRFIRWPNQQVMQTEAQAFAQRNGFQDIVGAVDGTHIKVNKPQIHAQRYFNRKHFYSLQLQAVCLHNMLFSHIFTGYPGSVHDARVLRQSDLWDDGLQLCNIHYHLLGDGAYPLRRWLLTPFRDNGHLTPQEKKFNTHHSSNRVVIERACALLKGRFSRLQFINTKSIELAVDIIVACCVLHNICIMQGEDIEDLLNEDDENDDGVQQPPAPMVDNEAEGIIKRNLIARNLY